MPKAITKFVCQQCGYESAQWLGKCPNCGTWNSLVETKEEVRVREREVKVGLKPQRLSEIKTTASKRIPTGIEEFDRVLGGGIVSGSVILLAGDPGIGKSTLLLQLAGNIKGQVLYVSGEESPEQIKIRAQRLGIKGENLLFLTETNVEVIIEQLETACWKLVVIDSIQTMWTSDLTGTAGSVGQVRESAAKFLNFAKSNQAPLFLVGHVTKEGAIAGPMVLAHLVDTILFFEGERYSSLRILRSFKNRFGPIDEVGIFSMEEKGLSQVDNPSKIFLSERRAGVPGSVVTCLLEGTRPLLVEIQALVVPTQLAIPRRVASGIDWNRLQLLVAVLTKRAGLPLFSFDIFLNVAGGIKISEPGADLAIALAVASAFTNKSVDPKVCAIGELGLLGEIRMIGQIEKRAKEAKRLGLKEVIGPKDFKTIGEAVKKLLKS